MQEPSVSVVVPVYNGARYLAAALESIFHQEFCHFEVIVVDDGSTDGSAEVARSYNVRYFYQANQGVASAWNTGVAASTGDKIAFLAQDDLWTPNKLAVQVAYLNDHRDIQYCIASARYFLEPGHDIPAGFRRELLGRDHIARIVETMLARRSVFDLVGRFDTSLGASQDVDWFARAKDLGVSMGVLPEVLLHRRIHSDNLTYRAVAESNRDLLSVLARSIRRQHDAKDG